MENRLETQLDSLNILFDDECTFEEAVKAWEIFFEHSYWNELSNTVKKQSFTDTEEFIGDLYPILEQFDVTIDCKVSGNGFTLKSLQ